MKNIKIIVFDLYNTLIEIEDSGHFFFRLYKKSENGFGLELSKYLKLVMTKDINELISTLPPDFEEIYNQNIIDLKKELKSVIVYEEVVNVLDNLKNDFRIFLISNLASPYKKPFFDFGLDQYFERMIFSSDCGILKPNKEIFEQIESITGNKPYEILMIGDSLKSDINGAKKMGWNYLRINRHGLLKDDLDIKNLKEIPNYITN